MKYTVPNDDLSKIDDLHFEINSYFDMVIEKYSNRKDVI